MPMARQSPGFVNRGFLCPSGIEPSDRARRSGLSRRGRGLHRPFFRHKRAQNGLFLPDPSLAKPACRRSPARSAPADRPRLPSATPCLQPSRVLPRYPRCRFASLTASRRHARPERCLTHPRGQSLPRWAALWRRYRAWQSASSTPPRAGAGFSWTSPAPSNSGIACGD